MRFEDRELTLKGKDKYSSNKVSVKISVPQYETHTEALQQVGGEDGALAIINDFLGNRASGSLRSKFAAFMKSAVDWASCEKYATEQAPQVRDYIYTERGPSRKAQHEILDSLSKEQIAAATPEELRKLLANLTGVAL